MKKLIFFSIFFLLYGTAEAKFAPAIKNLDRYGVTVSTDVNATCDSGQVMMSGGGGNWGCQEVSGGSGDVFGTGGSTPGNFVAYSGVTGRLIQDSKYKSSDFASNDATFITQTSNAILTSEQALDGLGTGLMKNTTGTGVVSIAVSGTDYASPTSLDLTYVPYGGAYQAVDLNNQALTTTSGTITGGTLTDGTATLTGGNLVTMGNITGTDVDIGVGTGTYTSTGDVNIGDFGFRTGSGGYLSTAMINANTVGSNIDLDIRPGSTAELALQGFRGGSWQNNLSMHNDGTISMDAYTTDGFVKFTGSVGQLAVDTTTYLGTASADVTYLLLNNANQGSWTPTSTVVPLLNADTLDLNDSSAFASSDGTFITQTANANLTNEQNLDALATGIMKNTNGTGVISIAVSGTDYADTASLDTTYVPYGGASKTVNLNNQDFTTTTGTITGGTLTDGTMSINGGAITSATGNISQWTNDVPYTTDTSADTTFLKLNADNQSLWTPSTTHVANLNADLLDSRDSSFFASADATFITQTASAGLSNEQALSGLTTGLMKVTNGTGVISTAVSGTDYADTASLDATYISIASADYTYLDTASAEYTYVTKASAELTYVDKASADATYVRNGGQDVTVDLNSQNLTNIENFEADEMDWSGGNVVYVPLDGDIDTYVNNATAGDTLVLSSGIYTTTAIITLDKKINLVGQGIGITTITTTSDHFMILVTASGSRISNMTLQHTETTTTNPTYMVHWQTSGEMERVLLDNQMTSTVNGAIFADAAGTVNIRDCVGTATGVTSLHPFLRSSHSDSIMNLYNCYVTSANANDGGYGGLVTYADGGDINIYNSTLSGTETSTRGVVFNEDATSTTNVYNSTLINPNSPVATQENGTIGIYATDLFGVAPTGSITYGGELTSGTLSDGTANINGGTITGAAGSNSQWTNTEGYITGNETITLSGALNGSGATSISAELNTLSISEDNLRLIDNTSWDVSTVTHGFAPKLSGAATDYLDGSGAWSVPVGGGGGGSSAWNTTNGAEVSNDVIYLVTADNNVIVGGSGSVGVAGKNVLALKVNASPTSSPASMTQLYSEAGTGAIKDDFYAFHSDWQMYDGGSLPDLGAGATFQTSSDYTATTASFFIAKKGSVSGHITGIMYGANAQAITATPDLDSGALATSISVDVTTLSLTSGWVDFDFQTPVALTSGTWYCVVIEAGSDYTASNDNSVKVREGNGSISGAVEKNGAGDMTWANQTTEDTVFRVYGLGAAELKVRDESGNVTTLSPHNFENIPEVVMNSNETNSDGLAWTYHSEKDGKEITVDMFGLTRAMEKLTGQQFIYSHNAHINRESGDITLAGLKAELDKLSKDVLKVVP